MIQAERCAKPFLRWAGGKKWFVKYLNDLIPQKINNYHELFLGSGATFFSLPKSYYKKAYLSDLNADLINAYNVIKNNPEELIDLLKTFKNNEQFFYKIREKHYEKNSLFNAARMIFLNKIGYNGIYRVNSLGKFNVPYGHRQNVDFVDALSLRKVNRSLQTAVIESIDFEIAAKKIKKNDFVFLDPPYTVAHENNGFIEYNQNLFSLNDQERLAQTIQIIKEKGAFYLLTNAKHETIFKIYSSIDQPRIFERHSHIGGNGARRGVVNEYIFTNVKN